MFSGGFRWLYLVFRSWCSLLHGFWWQNLLILRWGNRLIVSMGGLSLYPPKQVFYVFCSSNQTPFYYHLSYFRQNQTALRTEKPGVKEMRVFPGSIQNDVFEDHPISTQRPKNRFQKCTVRTPRTTNIKHESAQNPKPIGKTLSNQREHRFQRRTNMQNNRIPHV